MSANRSPLTASEEVIHATLGGLYVISVLVIPHRGHPECEDHKLPARMVDD